jgi:hypothetical protein
MIGLFVQVLRLGRALPRVVRQPEGRALTVLVVAQLTGGTLFDTLQEGWRWLDALYFSVTTLTTVGLGDLAPQTDAGKVFTIAFMLTGIGLLGTFIAMLARQLRPAHDPPACG